MDVLERMQHRLVSALHDLIQSITRIDLVASHYQFTNLQNMFQNAAPHFVSHGHCFERLAFALSISIPDTDSSGAYLARNEPLMFGNAHSRLQRL